MSALQFVYSYIKNCMQRTKINSEYSPWVEIMFGSIFKDLYLGLYYVIYSHVIYYLLWKTLTLQAMQMITNHTSQEIQLKK